MPRVTRACVIAVITLGLALCTCGGNDAPAGKGGTLVAVQKRGELTWGADLQGGEPFVYENPDKPDELMGFEVDIMAGIAKRLGVKPRFVQYQWSTLVPSLERGDFDIVMNGLEATADRRERILLSDPYYVYAETLTLRKNDPVHSIFELRDKKIGTLNQTVAHDILLMLPVEALVYEDNDAPYKDLAIGRSDAVLLDNIIADRYGCQDPALYCLPDDVARGTYVIGMRKNDDDLKVAIDAALSEMRKSGEMQAILEKHKLWDDRQKDAELGQGVERVTRTFDGDMFMQFLHAAWVTLELSVLAFIIAVRLGMLLAVARVYGAFPFRAFARVYIELFRGTPVLLQLFVLYYGLSSVIQLGAMQAAILGLGLNYAAYEAEVYRGALLALPRGQSEAARALGMGPWQTLRHVLIPQALRLALPPMTNDFVSLLKDSSLVSVITVIELTKRMTIAAVDMRGWIIPGLACAGFYLVLSFPLSELARRLERRLARDQRPLAL